MTSFFTAEWFARSIPMTLARCIANCGGSRSQMIGPPSWDENSAWLRDTSTTS